MSEAVSDKRRSVRIGVREVEIPADWDTVKLGELITVSGSGEWGEETKSEANSKQALILRSGDITLDGSLSKTDIATRFLSKKDYRQHAIEPKDIVIVSSSGSEKHIGKKWLAPDKLQKNKYHFTNFLYRIRLDGSECSPLFVYYFLCSDYECAFLESITPTSTGLQNLDTASYEDFTIPSPPLSEQHRIADILATVDEQIGQTDNIMRETRRLKEGLIQDLVFYGPDHEATQEVHLGPTKTEIAASWDVTSIGEITTKVQYGSSDSLSQDGEYPVFRMNNIEDGQMVASPMKYSDLSEDEAEKYRVEKGDILFNRTNSINLVGKSGIFDLDGEYVFASYLIRVRTNDEMNPYFLNYYLNSHVGQGILKSYATRGASQANINATSLKSIKVPLPPRDVQDKIVEQIQVVEQKIEEEQEMKDSLQELKRGLMQDLLTGTRRVSIPNTTTDD